MKVFFFLTVMALAAGPLYGQKKSKVDPKDLVIDSLTMVIGHQEAAIAELTSTLEEADSEMAHYAAAREVLKSKVVRYDFDPAAMSMILDTMIANRAKTTQGLLKQINELKDEILILQADNTRWQQALESMKEANADPDRIAAELRQLKSLLDMGILTQEEFDQKKARLLAKWE